MYNFNVKAEWRPHYGLVPSAGLPDCNSEPHLQVVLPVHHQSVAEHVPHDDQVGLLVVHAHAIHTQELWQQGVTVTLHDVLQKERF